MSRFIDDDGVARVRLISPGQGSSAYYKEEQLARDGVAFTGGQVYIDHPGRQESKDRPERSLRDLAGPIVGTPAYDKNGPVGPGLYGEVKVASHWRPFLEELGADIGASIRAGGSAVMEKIGGKLTKVAEKFNPGAGFDFVTKAGRGGKLAPMMEAALAEADGSVKRFMETAAFVESDGRSDEERFIEWMGRKTNNEGEDMDLQEAERKLTEATGQVTTLTEEKKVLTEANAELEKERDRLVETLALRDAAKIITEAVGDEKLKLHDVTQKRLIESLTKIAPIKEGKLDEAALREAVTDAVAEEKAYIEGLPHSKPGIRGMGEGGSDDGGRAKLIETKKAEYLKAGRTVEEAERMALLFAEGR